MQFIGVPFPPLYCSPRRYEVADASNPYVSATDVRFPDHTKVRVTEYRDFGSGC